MPQRDTQLLAKIREIREQFRSFELGDTETLVQVGFGIESVLGVLENDLALAAESLSLCLEGLQAIFQNEARDAGSMCRAVGATLAAVEQQIGSPENPVTANILQFSIERLRREFVGPSDLTDSNPSTTSLGDLNEIALMLTQTEASDIGGLTVVRDSLKALAAANAEGANRKALIKAARMLGRIVSGREKDPDTVLAAVNELMDGASGGRTEPQVDTSLQLAEPEATYAAVSDVEPEQTPPVDADELAPDSDGELVNEFIVESREMLEAAESSLLALEAETDNIEHVNTIFRAFHTIKGSAAYLGLKRLTELAHLAESLLSRMRDREIVCSGFYANLVLRSIDTLNGILANVQDALGGGTIALPDEYSDLLAELSRPNVPTSVVTANEVSGCQSPCSSPDDPRDEFKSTRLGGILIQMGRLKPEQLNEVLPPHCPLLGETLVEKGFVTETDVEEALTVQKSLRAPVKDVKDDSSVRVRTERLDQLIDMVGELVIAQSMLSQASTDVQGTHPELTRRISHAGKIVRELQDLSMGMRMIPLKNTFQKMTRLVRDLAEKCVKKVEFLTVGEDTEIDRNMVAFIADPLVHMVRNAVDHGIESPEVRKNSGKPVVGRVTLSAYHSGGDIVVELKDDGAGLNSERIAARAIERGLIETDKGMSEMEIFQLIFAPGFSMAAAVTDVSGRGVGMDVVRRNIEALRGRVEISAVKGEGSVFTIRLPLTLAITDGMLVAVGKERYIVPTIHIHLSFRPTAQMLSTVSGRGELVSLRGELMPVFRLHNLFDVKDSVEDLTEGLLMIVSDGRKRCALLVDELLGQHQVVAKNLGDGIGKIVGVSGGAILGDGCIGLILDTPELVALARQKVNTAAGCEIGSESKAA